MDFDYAACRGNCDVPSRWQSLQKTESHLNAEQQSGRPRWMKEIAKRKDLKN